MPAAIGSASAAFAESLRSAGALRAADAPLRVRAVGSRSAEICPAARATSGALRSHLDTGRILHRDGTWLGPQALPPWTADQGVQSGPYGVHSPPAPRRRGFFNLPGRARPTCPLVSLTAGAGGANLGPLFARNVGAERVMRRFVAGKNIQRYQAMLEKESDPARRHTLEQLLAEERSARAALGDTQQRSSDPSKDRTKS